MWETNYGVHADRLPATQLVLLPVAAWAAIHNFAAAVQHPLIRAEGLFLAPWLAAMVAVLLGVAPRPRVEAPVVGVLAAAVVWGVHADSTPAAAVGAMLVVALAVACARRLARGAWEMDLAALCATAIGLQILLRPELFLRGQALGIALAELLLLPVAGALAVAGLQRAFSYRGLVAALLAIVVSGGWSPTLVFWLAAAAAAGDLLDEEAGIPRLPLVVWMAAAGALGWHGGPDHLALLLALTGAGLITAAGRLRASRTLWPAAWLALAAGVGWFVYAGAVSGWQGGTGEAALLAVLLPAAAWSVLRRPRSTLPLLIVALLGLVVLPAEVGLAPVLPFLAFVLPRERPLLAVQGVWSASVAGVALLLGGYPWLRADPVRGALAFLGFDDVLVVAPVAVLTAVALGAAATFRSGRVVDSRATPAFALAIPLLAVVLQLPPVGLSVTSETILLHAGESKWRCDVTLAGALRTVVVDSYLANSAGVPAGEPVARVVLEADGQELMSWDLRAGEETGEWAARRSDIAAREDFRAPPTWLAWVEPEGRYFAQRYRSVLRTGEPLHAATLSIEHTSAAGELELVVTHVEVQP